MKSTHNRKELEQELKKKGIDVLFRQNDTDRIYGVTFIDHESCTVLNGSRLGKDFSANVFNDLFTGSRTLTTGNSKAEMQEHTQGNNPTGHLSEGRVKPLPDCSACYPAGMIHRPITAKFRHPRRKRRRNKNVFSNPKNSIMQNEDDLRGLAKVMDFMRAISILFVVINIYWFCYQSFREWGINIGVIDKSC